MAEGVVRHFDPGKGTGIIEAENGEELPVHRSAIADDSGENLYPGDIVEYKLGKNRFGRRAALNIRRIGWEEQGGDDEPREWNF